MKTLLSWSSGKDSAWTLGVLREDPGVELCGLFTTLNREAERVAMHGVRRHLLESQAEVAGLSLRAIDLPHPCSNEAYQEAVLAELRQAREAGIEAVAFGDLYLEDVRRYREELLEGTGLRPLFPLWGRDTRALAEEMLAAGLDARLTCLDPRRVPREWAGRKWDAALLAELPEGVDPCGENGEFHTFVASAPAFRGSIATRPGEVVEREGFVFADVLPA